MAKNSTEVVIVGAGAAGLAAAATLSRAGVAVVVLEARSRAGGRVATRRVRGWPVPVELGAEFIHGRSEEIFRIAGRAGLLVGRITDVHARVTGSRWTPMRDFWATFDRITRRMRGSGRDRSVAEFLDSRRRMPRPEKQLLASIVEGYHAAPLELASEHALSTAGAPPPSPEDREQFRILSGYDGVTRWLASRIDPRRCRFVFSAAAREIRWRPGSVQVRTERSGEFRARRAIVTVPVGVLNAPAEQPAGIRFDPEPRDQRRALEKIGMGQVVKAVLRLRPHFGEILRERFPAGESGAGEIAFLHRRGAPFPTWWSAAPAEVPMITAWAGGPAAQALRRSSRREILGEALQTIASLLDAPGAPTPIRWSAERPRPPLWPGRSGTRCSLPEKPPIPSRTGQSPARSPADAGSRGGS